jgi:D-glycero-alpha-D-manno-heptose-7-phosphate kinase
VIISRTPYRISFFGGGTDYHTWYQEQGGAVLSTTINHYCYLNCRFLPPFFKEKTRVVWSQIEQVTDHNDIVHPAVRGVLNYLNIEGGVEIQHTGDLPARSGLGSSSAFTVGLLHAMHALHGRMSSKRELACEAVHIERNVLKENVGVQDQIATAFGGFNKISILPNGTFHVDPVIVPQARIQELQSHFMLFFTGVSRTASEIAKEQIKTINDKRAELTAMRLLVDEALATIQDGDITEVGHLLHETWQLKRSLASGISPGFVDDIYAKARNAGAIGGKLLGAGGGGFMLFFAKPENHLRIMQALGDLLWVPFEFETGGSNLIFYDQNASYSQTSLTRRDFYHLRDQAARTGGPTHEDIVALNQNLPQVKRLMTV